MLYHSFAFALFFLITYGLYIVLEHTWQNRLLLVASYIFYGAWDWRFLSLIVISTLVTHWVAIRIEESTGTSQCRHYLAFGIGVNLLILGIFKYHHFFVDSFMLLLHSFGITWSMDSLSIVLPVGISFYTFQSMSYALDVYRKQIKAEPRLSHVALYIAFFPQLVAGPIMRAAALLPQIKHPRKFNQQWFYESFYLFGWGLFLKIFIADALAYWVDPTFALPGPYGPAQLWLMGFGFTLQCVCDFTGYSFMARGLGRIMGFDIPWNFKNPFFVTNIQSFWKNYHISLSTWIRDYVYTPLFMSLRTISNPWRIYITVVVTMVIMGFWHGAHWPYVAWGFYHGFVLVAYSWIHPYVKKVKPKTPLLKSAWTTICMIFILNVTVLGMLIFRAESIGQLLHFSLGLFAPWAWGTWEKGAVIYILAISSLYICYLIFQYKHQDMDFFMKLSSLKQWAIVLTLIYLMIGMYLMSTLVNQGAGSPFVYFQF